MNISKITTKLFTVSAFAGALICGTAKLYSQRYVYSTMGWISG